MPRSLPEFDPEYFVQAIEDCAVGVEILTTDGTFLWVNPAFERMSGYTRDECIGRTARELLRSHVHPPEFYEDAMATMHRGETWRAIMTSRRKDGTLFDSEMTGSQARRSSAGPLHLLVLRRDVTEQRRTLRALTEREAPFGLACQVARDGLWDWDIAARRFYASSRWFDLHEQPVRPVDIDWHFEQIHPDDRDAARGALNAHLAGHTSYLDHEHRLLVPSGFRWVQFRGLAERDQGGVAVRIAGSLTDISDRKHAEGELLRVATHDSLTGVPNRANFVLQVEHAIARARRRPGTTATFALLFIDLRRFKQVNDGYGHVVGDALLREVASRVQSTLRAGDTLARLGGDEFAVLLDGVSDATLAHAAAERLERVLARPVEVEGRVLPVSATIGVALGNGSSQVDELVRAADEAMYEARSRGDRGHHLAGPAAGFRSERKAKIAAALGSAMTDGEIRVVYQPIVDIWNGRTRGAEALARWTHPELGPVAPTEFVAIAEASGLGPRLGRHVLDTVAAQVRAWEDTRAVPNSFFVNVNVSARQLLDKPLVDHVLALHETGAVRRGRLGLEITETVLIERPEEVARTMAILRRAGVHFSLDDFGTGYSSLSHMRGFPVQAIKIDRSFVEKAPDDAVTAQIVSGLLQMASALGLLVVAEGVETPAQERTLRHLGFGLAQGYFYGKPVPPTEFSILVERQNQLEPSDAGVIEP
ncbi:MAG: EAL domain-containing protein [Deltaproteobacteria bacterium]|nr:EAL domain-containing protein [Deltaproteobacteria bacterium]